MAPPTPIQITPRRVEADEVEADEVETGEVETGEVEFVEDLDVLVESSKCACNAGDDNPY
jgi:hypothetical protein